MPFLPEWLLEPRREPVRPLRIPYAVGYVPPEQPAVISPPAPPFITGEQLRGVVVNLSPERAEEIATLICRIAPQYGLDNYDIFHEFLAQVAHESGGFRLKEENLNYTWQRLRAVFPKYFSSDAIAQQYHRQPARIANRVYANRMGNGPEVSGDGWAYRGGGFIQLTGAEIWRLYSRYCSIPLASLTELVRSSDDYALDSACWYFSVHAALNGLALQDEFEAITRRVNGGLNGYQDRLDYYERAKLVLV